MSFSGLKNFLCMSFMVAVLATAFAPSSHAATYAAQDVEVYDPMETANRAIYGFNKFMDNLLFKPVAKTYRFIIPKFARKGIRNALRNLTEPVTFLNSALQCDMNHSMTTLGRFALNSTFGIAGIFDIAKDAGLHHRKEDFGQTIGYYGTGHGPYLMLPVLGPSNTRDTFGLIVDAFTDPFNYLDDELVITRTLISGLDAREETLDLVEEIDRVSLDPYAATRSLYTQKRVDEIRNGKNPTPSP